MTAVILYFQKNNWESKMKRLFLIFGALFAIAGCADESGTNGVNTETCPITSADFSYERIPQDSYEMQYKIKLDNESKRQYENNVKWVGGNDRVTNEPFEYNELEPLLIYEHNPSQQKEATFFPLTGKFAAKPLIQRKMYHSTNPSTFLCPAVYKSLPY